MSSTEWTHRNNWERLRTRKRKTDDDANMDPENLHPEINDLVNGIDDGEDEMDNDHSDDLHNDIPQNRGNQKGDHHLLPGLE